MHNIKIILKKVLRNLKILAKLNFKTIYFNYKYFPIKQAIKFPIRVSNKVSLLEMGGKIIIDCPISYQMIQIGYGKVGIFDKEVSRSIKKYLAS